MDYREDPLDRLLDSESDEEFGEPVIRDSNHHHAREDVDGNLKSWTAEDFASIYHRFRPHLVRHARRYLQSETQAEEVVQDAFLFLMTALPEIDNELGVLKFLKWKIKYLSLDLIRAESKSTNLEPNSFDKPSENAPVDEEILRAEDSAVIQLALAKLNPRQREALVASVYGEKSSEEVAEQLGLSPNATRQLIFRARSAFKKALVGEAEIQGKSIGQVLTIAAKKAAMDAKENAVKVGAFVVLLAVGIGIVPSLMPSNETVIAESPVIESSEQSQLPMENKSGVDSAPEAPAPNQEQHGAEVKASTGPTEQSDKNADQGDESAQTESSTDTEPATDVNDVAGSEVQDDLLNEDPLLLPQTFGQVLSTTAASAFYYQNSRPSIFESFDGESIQIFAGTGVSAFLDYRPDELTIYNAILQLRIENELFYAIPTSFDKKTNYDGNSFELIFEGANFYLVREDGTVVSDSIMSGAESKASIKLNTKDEIVSTSLDVRR